VLNAFKRPQLQALSKRCGLKANGRTLELLSGIVGHFKQLQEDTSSQLSPIVDATYQAARPVAASTVHRTPLNPVFNPRYQSSSKAPKAPSVASTADVDTRATWLVQRQQQLADLEAEIRSIRLGSTGGKRGPGISSSKPAKSPLSGRKRSGAGAPAPPPPTKNAKPSKFMARLSRFAPDPPAASPPRAEQAKPAGGAGRADKEQQAVVAPTPPRAVHGPRRSAAKPSLHTSERASKASEAYINRMRKAQQLKASGR
jgi:hypothetical protein